MRKSVWIICFIAAALCVLLIMSKRYQRTDAPQEVTISSNEQNQTAPQPAEQRVVAQPAIPVAPLNIVSAVSPVVPVADSNTVDPRVLAAWQASITFYGKVIDENSNPVSGVKIHFRWSEKPTEDGMRTVDTQSDSQGLFALQGVFGRSLTVWFNKDGYYSSQRGQKSFNYALGPDIYSPDSQNPTIFNLHSKGNGETLVSLKQNYRIPRDGTPLAIDLTTGKTTTGQDGNLVVQCWTKDDGKRPGERYDWRCVVSIPGGGAIETEDEFAFQAPESGYVPSIEIDMPADQPNWQDNADLKFYYQLADGLYGRMTFSMIAGGHHFCMINSVFNPNGSRNLEPAQ
jgi:hypothetical protein